LSGASGSLAYYRKRCPKIVQAVAGDAKRRASMARLARRRRGQAVSVFRMIQRWRRAGMRHVAPAG
jgi:hypothetical protein